MMIVGRITKDAVVQQLKDERQVVNFTVAIDYYKAKGSSEGKQVALFIQCSYWLSMAIADRLTKGTLVELTGRLYVNAYINLQGEAQASLKCHVNSIKIYQKGKEGSYAENKTNANAKQREPIEDLPF